MVVGDRDLPGARGAQRRGGQPVPEQLVVRGRERAEHQLPAGRVHAEPVAEGHDHERLVQRDPHRDPVGEPLRGEPRVVGEPVRGVPCQPAAVVFEGLRQVPVEQGGGRGDAAGQQRVGQPVVEVQARPVGRALPVRLHPRPGDREPVAGQPEAGHQLDVGRPAVVVIGRHVAGLAVPGRARLAAEHVPDRLAAAVLGGRALDLVRRGGNAPGEVGGERRHRSIGHAAIVRSARRPGYDAAVPSVTAASTSAWRAASSAAYFSSSTRSAISSSERISASRSLAAASMTPSSV